MSVSKLVGALAAALLAVGVIVPAQNSDPGVRLLLSETGAPGINRGLRDDWPPRPARSASPDITTSPGAPPYLRGSIVVKFKTGTSTGTQRLMLTRAGGATSETPSYADFNVVSIDPDADPQVVARTLAAQPDVEYAQPRYRMHPLLVPNDPLYTLQWNFPAIDMERAWDLIPGSSSSVTVAVIDSGVAFRSALMRYSAGAVIFDNGSTRTTLPALGPVDVPFAAAPDLGPPDRFVAPRDFIWDSNDAFDLDGHGTHVAGTIGQLTNNGLGVAGMAFNVRIMPVKVIDGAWDVVFRSPGIGTDDVVARGVRYAVDNGAKVLNMSLGETEGPSPVLRSALEYAVSRGAFVAISAGNGFENGNQPSWPAVYASDIKGVVSVGAIGRDRRRAYYSTTGSYVELAAPGGNDRVGGANGMVLQQTFDFDFVETYLNGPTRYRAPRFDVFTYQFLEGTSMAAPHVSGFAALLIQQGITSPAAIEAAMEQFATDLGTPGKDPEFGYGLINPRASLRGLGIAK